MSVHRQIIFLYNQAKGLMVEAESRSHADEKKRAVTNLYNARATRLDLVHKRLLDKAVFVAYGWNPDLSDEEILQKLPALNLERAKS